MFQYYITFLPLVLFGAFAILLMAKKWMDDRRWAKASRDKLLRPAGESLRLRIEEIDSKINDSLMTVGFAVVIQIVLFVLLTETTSGIALIYVLGSVTILTFSVTLWYLGRTALLFWRRLRYAQGFHGERLVGEQLSLLMLDGYRVFHDLQFDGFNINHAVVGPGGVIAIETKTHRKRKNIKPNPIVKFDGEQLHWPDGKVNDWDVKNAYDRANSMRKWLCNAIGETIKVYPVLTFPGWMVESDKDGPVKVLNPKLVGTYLKALEKYDEVISETLINRISHQLAEKSRLPSDATLETNPPTGLESNVPARLKR